MDKHEYLRELFPDGFPHPFNEEDYPAFDKRDTFNLNDTIVLWLYEQLRFFQSEASKIVDFTFHKFDIDGEELTQMECINRMIKDCKTIALGNDYNDAEFEKMDAAKDDLFKVFSKVYWAMWW